MARFFDRRLLSTTSLRDEILAGKLRPGQRISIDGLAARWGVSSTPMGDAVKRLDRVTHCVFTAELWRGDAGGRAAPILR